MDYHTTLTVLQRDTNVHKVLTKERRVAGERRWQEKGGGRRKEVAGKRRVAGDNTLQTEGRAYHITSA